MIVEKAVNMAGMMDKKVIGLVENMSYFVCPDCGGKHQIFGESRIESLAERFGIPNIARLPINSAFAAAGDEGRIEDVRVDDLRTLGDFIERGAY